MVESTNPGGRPKAGEEEKDGGMTFDDLLTEQRVSFSNTPTHQFYCSGF